MTGAEPTAARVALLAELVAAMRVAPASPDTFRAESPDWWGDRIFGGMVVAQALVAAIRTVDAPLRPHSIHGCFLRAVVPGPPVNLTVERVRDGRTFTTRQVTALQLGKETSRFICSFHAEEDGDEYQLPMPDVPRPQDLAVAEMPGPFDACDAGPLPAPDGTFRSSARLWHRTAGPLPDDPTVHAAVLAFFSDMTRTSFRPLSLDTWGTHTEVRVR